MATTADGRLVCVTHAGTHELSVIDVPGVMEKLSKIPVVAKPYEPGKPYDDRGSFSSPTQSDVPNDLAFLVDLRRRISLRGISPWSIKPTGPMANGPHGVAIVGSTAYVALYFSDNLAVVDLGPKPEKPVSWIPLGPEPQLTAQRRGQMFFHDADLCFQHWQSCASCHPDARVDGLNWDLLNDGLGNPKNNRSMLLAHKTPPSMWEGVRPTAEDAVRSGIKNIQFAVRPEEDAVAIDEYLKSLTPVPSPHLVHGQLSESAKRGKALFFSERVGCATCHPEPLYTDLKMHDVESKGQYDRRPSFDTPNFDRMLAHGPLPARRPLRHHEAVDQGRQARPQARRGREAHRAGDRRPGRVRPVAVKSPWRRSVRSDIHDVPCNVLGDTGNPDPTNPGRGEHVELSAGQSLKVLCELDELQSDGTVKLND